MKSTIRDYYFSNDLIAKATVLQLRAQDDIGSVILDRTIFVPQGGGQPADIGTIAGRSVGHVEASKETPDIIIHSVASLDGLAEGEEVELCVTSHQRQLHSRLHTAGHLIAGLAEQILPGAKACGGHHWPGESRVEFAYLGALSEDFEQICKVAVANAIAADFAIYTALSSEGHRHIRIGDYPALRCGGTHCGHLNEIGDITLRSIKLKKERLRIGYDVQDGAPIRNIE